MPSTTANNIFLVLAGAAGTTAVNLIGLAASRFSDNRQSKLKSSAYVREKRLEAYSQLLSAVNRCMEGSFEGQAEVTPTARADLLIAVGMARLIAGDSVATALDQLLDTEDEAASLRLQAEGSSVPLEDWTVVNDQYRAARQAFVEAAQAETGFKGH